MDASTPAPPRLSVMLSGFHRIFGPDLRMLVEGARVVESAGANELLLGDHVVMGDAAGAARYPYGTFRYAPDEPWPEPLTVLASLAAATSRIRLGTGVLLAPLRPAVLLAKTAATLDVLSGGRLELGVGVGWQREEYEALGLDHGRRWAILDDTMRACRLLWSGQAVSFSSASVSFDGITCSPAPVQQRLRVWIGARATPAHARRLAEYGDGWFPLEATTPDAVAAGVDVLREALAGAGREPSSLRVRVPLALTWNADGSIDVGATAETGRGLAEAGASMLWVALGPHLPIEIRTMSDIGAIVERLSGAVSA